MSDQSDTDDAAPGWDAIDAAFDRLYPGRAPLHFGSVVPAFLGGNDPLNGISAWKRLDPVPHWHFVTYGFSELYEKESEDPEESGFGFELTMRVACTPDAETPPPWVMNMLQNLARYVFKSGNRFADGHWLNTNGPIALETGTQLCSIAFIADPELPTIDTPNGRVAFLQVVGLTLDEEAAIKRWNARKLLETLAPLMPLWITDLDRTSLLSDPDTARQVEEGSRREGSSTGMIFLEKLDWTVRKPLLRKPVTEVTLGANHVANLTDMLGLRLPFGNDVTLMGTQPGRMVRIVPGHANQVTERDETHLTITLTGATVDALAGALNPVAGRYPVPGFDALALQIEPTLIRNQQGEVVKTVG
ncbi:suppressor of fused domain protein [Sphingomonas sp. HF-S3]|uniref:Suppressor of fused domain protein n=1 Tax=Sphingomonas rustica TaxID=3103142 RepID=A0ABV0BDS1_9SPHN